ncbi:unnamed protein product, partial [Brenthis ino]
MYKLYLLFVLCPIGILKANFEIYNHLQSNVFLQYNGEGYLFPYPNQCYEILDVFAQHASNLTLCSILNARPITVCERCVEQYVKFRDKYQELLNTTVNGTSCRSVFISHDRLNAVQEYHDNILSVWNKGKCNGCFDWNHGIPSLKNSTISFHKMFNDTMKCIVDNMYPQNNDVCNRCMQSYLQLDEFYKSLSSDSIGVDSVCMDIVDSMNATHSIWSKSLNCCKLRRTPEIVFLCCAGIISLLPLIYYMTVRFCGPIRDLPNVLKQSRFKQSFLRSVDNRSD